jgi:hypothetical protein
MARSAIGVTCALWAGMALLAGACGDEGGGGTTTPDGGAAAGGSSGSAFGGSGGSGANGGAGGSTNGGSAGSIADGSAGAAGSAGQGGTAGEGGTAGQDGSAGQGGSAGQSGSSGNGGSSGSGADAGPPLDCTAFANVTQAAACAAYANAYCTFLDTCAPAGLFLYSSVAHCKQRIELQCASSLTAPQSNFNPPMFAAGADALGKLTCAEFYATGFDSLGEPGPGCGGPGTLGVGKQCYANSQCASGDCLEGDPCGICTGVGTACEASLDCLDDAFCNALDQCELKKSAGQACGAHDQCTSDTWCGVTCQPDKPLGATCTEDAECAKPLICGANNQCKPPALGAQGASCTPGETLSCNASFMLVCDTASQTCVPDPLPGPGDPCGLVQQGGMTVFEFLCGGDSTCVFTSGLSGTCVANAPDGAACNETTGPHCMFLASCVNGSCVVPNATLCPPN